jgi:hypothetical protein
MKRNKLETPTLCGLTKEERDIMTRAEWVEDSVQAAVQTAYEDGWDGGQLGITLDYIRDGDLSVERASQRLGLPVSVIEEYLLKELPQ